MNIVEDENNGIVKIDEIELIGFIDDVLCDYCKKERIYFDDFDSFFCAHCNIWLEQKCCDSKCEYC